MLIQDIYDWAEDNHIVRANYHGGAIDGPNLNRLLTTKKLDSLEAFVDEKFCPFVECLRFFALVKSSCFGMTLSDDWEANIHIFKLSYEALPISVTPKAHSVWYEIPIFIWRYGRPMGFFSEAKYEHVHQVT